MIYGFAPHHYDSTSVVSLETGFNYSYGSVYIIMSVLHYDIRWGGSRILVWEGHWQGVWGTEVPQWGLWSEPREGSGGQKAEECYLIRLKKHLCGEKNKSIELDIV